MSVIVPVKSLVVADCHFVILLPEVLPLRVKVVEFVPEQTVALPAIVPGVIAELTVTVAVELATSEQEP
jgi:hypothetical protein